MSYEGKVLADLRPAIGDTVKVTHSAVGKPTKDGGEWIIDRREGDQYYGVKPHFSSYHKGTALSKQARFRIIKCADEPWSIFNNKMPLGLLSDEQKSELRDWDGDHVLWCGGDNWMPPSTSAAGFYNVNVYRAVPKPEPTVEEQVDKAALEQLWELLGVENQTEAVQRIQRLLDMRKSLEVLTNGSL